MHFADPPSEVLVDRYGIIAKDQMVKAADGLDAGTLLTEAAFVHFVFGIEIEIKKEHHRVNLHRAELDQPTLSLQ